MNVSVSILDGPLQWPPATPYAEAGAVVTFQGIVREMEDGRPLDALHYDTYEPMAQNMLQAIAQELGELHQLLAVQVVHSRGRVAVGECSFQLIVAATHRREALAAMGVFIDRMKEDVPIWKRPIWRGAREPETTKAIHEGPARGV